MEKARIAFVEDSPDIVKVFTMRLERAGHMVVVAAAAVDELRELTADMEPDEVDVALVDGSLLDGTGEEAVAVLRESFPDAHLLGIAGERDVEGVDANIHKSRVSTEGSSVWIDHINEL